MENILREIMHAFRQFHDSLGFSATAVLILALGIGATTATFSVVEAVLLRPLLFQDPARLVALGDLIEGTAGHDGVTTSDLEQNGGWDFQMVGRLNLALRFGKLKLTRIG